MKKNNKQPFSWKLEEYAFGAVALREEIKRHKKEDVRPWGIFKTIGIRALLIYAIIASCVLALIGLFLQCIQRLKSTHTN